MLKGLKRNIITAIGLTPLRIGGQGLILVHPLILRGHTYGGRLTGEKRTLEPNEVNGGGRAQLE